MVSLWCLVQCIWTNLFQISWTISLIEYLYIYDVVLLIESILIVFIYLYITTEYCSVSYVFYTSQIYVFKFDLRSLYILFP